MAGLPQIELTTDMRASAVVPNSLGKSRGAVTLATVLATCRTFDPPDLELMAPSVEQVVLLSVEGVVEEL